jgi:sugar phosphate isomerase/epimerase
MTTRRSFFKQAGVGLVLAGSAPAIISTSASARQAGAGNKTADPFKVGIAGYTFKNFKLDQTLAMLKKVDVHYLCIKDFHLPLKATDAEITAFHATCKAAGVTGYGVGPIYMGSEEEVDNAFEYAKRVGVKVLVGVPFKMVDKKRASSPELLKLVDRKVREYDIKYAIHNHGPDMPELFPTAESAIELIKDLDKRVGLCLDVGHQYRDGKDPVKAVVQYADRLHDMHTKNVTENTKKGRGIELPRGAIDFPALVKAMRQINYTGVCSLEYEKDMEDPLTGIAESIGYFRGILDGTRAE